MKGDNPNVMVGKTVESVEQIDGENSSEDWDELVIHFQDGTALTLKSQDSSQYASWIEAKWSESDAAAKGPFTPSKAQITFWKGRI